MLLSLQKYIYKSLFFFCFSILPVRLAAAATVTSKHLISHLTEVC